VGALCLALYVLYGGWAVYTAGNMAAVSCSGAFSRISCDLGLSMGQSLFGPAAAHLGYVLLRVGFAAVFVCLAWLAYARSKA
jgi:hypothetical protein